MPPRKASDGLSTHGVSTHGSYSNDEITITGRLDLIPHRKTFLCSFNIVSSVPVTLLNQHATYKADKSFTPLDMIRGSDWPLLAHQEKSVQRAKLERVIEMPLNNNNIAAVVEVYKGFMDKMVKPQDGNGIGLVIQSRVNGHEMTAWELKLDFRKSNWPENFDITHSFMTSSELEVATFVQILTEPMGYKKQTAPTSKLNQGQESSGQGTRTFPGTECRGLARRYGVSHCMTLGVGPTSFEVDLDTLQDDETDDPNDRILKMGSCPGLVVLKTKDEAGNFGHKDVFASVIQTSLYMREETPDPTYDNAV
jgi:hypothetical protein